jgi:hypothetical protein
VEFFERNYDQYRAPAFIDPADVAPQDLMAPFVTQTAAVVDLHARLAAEGVPHDLGGRPRSRVGLR